MRVLLVLLVASCTGCWSGTTTRIGQDGALDLASWDFDRDGSVALDGDWAFY